jgi:hypothetical protein
MNPQIKKIFIQSGLFEEIENSEGLFFAQKINYDSENDINMIINNITEEYIKSIENWRDADTESEESDYFRGYRDACNDILEEFKERFKN